PAGWAAKPRRRPAAPAAGGRTWRRAALATRRRSPRPSAAPARSCETSSARGDRERTRPPLARAAAARAAAGAPRADGRGARRGRRLGLGGCCGRRGGSRFGSCWGCGASDPRGARHGRPRPAPRRPRRAQRPRGSPRPPGRGRAPDLRVRGGGRDRAGRPGIDRPGVRARPARGLAPRRVMKSPFVSEVERHLEELAETASRSARELSGRIAEVAEMVIRTYDAGGKLFFCGTGGRAADAQQRSTEYAVRCRRNRRALPAIALTTDTSLLTAASNDLGFEHVFARQIRALARAGDIVFLHSTSGRSPNLLEAARAARDV